jgi:hypothetical protein
MVICCGLGSAASRPEAVAQGPGLPWAREPRATPELLLVPSPEEQKFGASDNRFN